jgi:type II secretory pathway component PulF
VGQLITYSQFSQFSRTLSLLLESGIPLLKAIQTSLPVVTNQVIRVELQKCHAAIVEGGSFGEALRRSERVPAFVAQLIRAGEESGRLQESLNDISDWYEQELQENAEVLTKLLEPILILAVGSILGLMVIAVLLPIFSMNAAVS